MHDIDRTQTEFLTQHDSLEFETDQFEADQFEMDQLESGDVEFDQELDTGEFESPITEAQEMELATELLSISNDAELDQFLGKLLKGAWRGLRKVGSAIGRVARPMGGLLKGVAKKLLPVAAGAAGTFFGGPAGGALGAKLGSLASKALEMEMDGLEMEDQEFETARRFVRIAATAAKNAAAANPAIDPQTLAKQAVIAAVKRHVPNLISTSRQPIAHRPIGTAAASSAIGVTGRAGRWIRRGRKIILLGV